MIGKPAKVVTDCRPKGQVRLEGALWEATCAAGADAGDTVKVLALDGLTLVVEPEQAAPVATGTTPYGGRPRAGPSGRLRPPPHG